MWVKEEEEEDHIVNILMVNDVWPQGHRLDVLDPVSVKKSKARFLIGNPSISSIHKLGCDPWSPLQRSAVLRVDTISTRLESFASWPLIPKEFGLVRLFFLISSCYCSWGDPSTMGPTTENSTYLCHYKVERVRWWSGDIVRTSRKQRLCQGTTRFSRNRTRILGYLADMIITWSTEGVSLKSWAGEKDISSLSLTQILK